MKTLVTEFVPFNTGTGMHKQRNPGSPGRHYEYLYAGKRELRAGDWALVHNGDEFGLVVIARVKPGIGDKVTKHVCAVFTQDDFMNYNDANRHIEEHRKVFDQLDYMMEEDKKLEKYREFAQRNPEAAALLEKTKIWSGPVIESQSAKPAFEDADTKSTIIDSAKAE